MEWWGSDLNPRQTDSACSLHSEPIQPMFDSCSPLHIARTKSWWAYGKEEILTWKLASADGLAAPRVKWPPSMTMLVSCSLEAAFLYTISSTVSRPIRRMTLTDLCENQVRTECVSAYDTRKGRTRWAQLESDPAFQIMGERMRRWPELRHLWPRKTL